MLKLSMRCWCQPGSSALRPLRIGRAVGAHVDRRRRALEDVEVLGRRAEVRHALHGRGAGADDADALAAQAGEIRRSSRRRCSRSPSGWCGTSGRANDSTPGMPGSFGRLSGPFAMQTKRARMRSPRLVATIQRARGVVPAHLRHFGLEARVAVEVELRADRAAVGEDLRRARVLLARHVAELFEQRQVDVRLDVAHRARVAVPVPGAAEVAALLDDAHVVDAGLAQPRAGQQAAEAAADDHHLDLVGERRAREARRDVRDRRRSGRSRPSPRRYWSLPSARRRLSRSARYFSRNASGSNGRARRRDLQPLVAV